MGNMNIYNPRELTVGLMQDLLEQGDTFDIDYTILDNFERNIEMEQFWKGILAQENVKTDSSSKPSV